MHAIVRPESKAGSLPPAVRMHLDDGSAAALDKAVADALPSVCFHLAGMFLGMHRADQISPLVASNVTFGTRVAEALSRIGGALLLSAGTYWQHVDGAAYRPAALYAATKQAYEDLLRYYTDDGSLRAVALRLFDTYGPHDPRQKLLNLLLGAAASGQPLGISGGEQLVELVHVDDVTRAFLVAAEAFGDWSARGCPRYSVDADDAISLRDLVMKVETITGRRIDARWGDLPYRRNEMFERWDAGARLPGWEPLISLDRGIASLWRLREGQGAGA